MLQPVRARFIKIKLRGHDPKRNVFTLNRAMKSEILEGFSALDRDPTGGQGLNKFNFYFKQKTGHIFKLLDCVLIFSVY